jgi:hypothetical protein
MIAPMWTLRRMGIHPSEREVAAYQKTWVHVGFVVLSFPLPHNQKLTLFLTQLPPWHLSLPPHSLLRLLLRHRRDLLRFSRLLRLPDWPSALRPLLHAAIQDPLRCLRPSSTRSTRRAPYRAYTTLLRGKNGGSTRPPVLLLGRQPPRRRRSLVWMGTSRFRAPLRSTRRFEGEGVGGEEAEMG